MHFSLIWLYLWGAIICWVLLSIIEPEPELTKITVVIFWPMLFPILLIVIAIYGNEKIGEQDE